MFLWIANGSIELKIIPGPMDRGNLAQDLPVLCAGQHLRIQCNATGGHLRWNHLAVLTFTAHDSTHLLVDDEHNLVAVLMDISHKSNGKAQFISELYSQNMLTASSMSLNITTISCSTDTSESSLPITIAGSHLQPQKPAVSQTTFIQHGNNLNSSCTSRLYYLKWNPPDNTDRLILANYSLQIGNETEWIKRSKVEEYFCVSGNVTTGTFTAISICGTSSNAVTLNFTVPVHSVTTTSSPQTVNFHDTLLDSMVLLILMLGLILIVLLIAVLVLIVCLLIS